MSEDQIPYDIHGSGRFLTENEMVQTVSAKQYRQMMEKLTELSGDWSAERVDQRIRIEALRAAALLIAHSPSKIVDGDGKIAGRDEMTLAVADQFAKWLER